jgi:hypothetical protein
MSFESDPTRDYDVASEDSERERGLAARLIAVVDTLGAIPKRVAAHLSEWPRRYVEMRTRAVPDEK